MEVYYTQVMLEQRRCQITAWVEVSDYRDRLRMGTSAKLETIFGVEKVP